MARSDLPIFIRGRINHLVAYSCRSAMAVLARSRYRVRSSIHPDDLEKLRRLRRSRVIFLPNHPMPHDFLLVYKLSFLLGQPFYYMTAHEQFRGPKRWLLPRLGCYSIRRGGWGDKASVRRTLEILSRPACRLVVFPEGRCSFMRNRLCTFRQGPVRLGLKTLLRLDQSNGAEDLFAVPLVIVYRFQEDIGWRLELDLDRLARRLGTNGSGPPEARVSALVATTVERLEKARPRSRLSRSDDLKSRIKQVSLQILAESENRLGIDRAPRPGVMDRACNIRQVLAVRGRALGVLTRRTYDSLSHATLVVLCLDSLMQYDLDNPRPHEIVDILTMLERIVYRVSDPVPKGRREATIRVGRTLNLRDWLPCYRRSPVGTVTDITRALQQIVEGELEVNGTSR